MFFYVGYIRIIKVYNSNKYDAVFKNTLLTILFLLMIFMS